MSNIPDRINIEKKDRLLFNKLDQEEILKFKGGRRTRKEQFLFAMTVGFKNSVKHTLENKEGWFLIKDLQPKDEALINAIAIMDANSIEILADKGAVCKIAEEYAHAGIKLLSGEIETTSLGSFDKKLEKELYRLLDEQK